MIIKITLWLVIGYVVIRTAPEIISHILDLLGDLIEYLSYLFVKFSVVGIVTVIISFIFLRSDFWTAVRRIPIGIVLYCLYVVFIRDGDLFDYISEATSNDIEATNSDNNVSVVRSSSAKDTAKAPQPEVKYKEVKLVYNHEDGYLYPQDDDDENYKRTSSN